MIHPGPCLLIHITHALVPTFEFPSVLHTPSFNLPLTFIPHWKECPVVLCGVQVPCRKETVHLEVRRLLSHIPSR